MPAQVADSKDGLHCGRCGARRGSYGKDFGIAPDGNPLSVVGRNAFDITMTKSQIAALCWNCAFSYSQTLKPFK
jgi:hypothetical protein